MDAKGTREIRFRGKRIDNGEWVEGYFVNLWLMHYQKHQPIITDNNAVSYDVDHSTVGQYTGLCDKNGKKIFEGDIMAFTAYGFDYVGTVEFADGSFSIMCEHTSPFLDQAVSKHGAYIIGNMHDNPELLGAQNDQRTSKMDKDA